MLPRSHFYPGLASAVENRLLAKKDIFTCFIDFRKAFDCVDHVLLWKKLEECYKIQGNFLSTLKPLVNCMVDANTVLSDWFEVTNGIKQGCILSPTLFAMNIDDLVDSLSSARVGIARLWKLHDLLPLYTDDIVILAPDEDKLEKLLKVVEQWCNKWKMTRLRLLISGKERVINPDQTIPLDSKMTKFTGLTNIST